MAKPSASNASVKSAPKAPVVQYHRELYAAAAAGRKAESTMMAKFASILYGRYGDTPPTFEQVRADRAALKALAAEKGLVDDQWLRKPYNTAVKATWNLSEMPVSMDPAAVAKRAQRPGKAGKPDAKEGEAAKPGPAKGETAARKVSDAETLEQLIARMGVGKALQAIAAILAAERATAECAKRAVSLAAEITAVTAPAKPVAKAA